MASSSSAIPTSSSFSISFRGHRHGHLLLEAPHHPGPSHRHRREEPVVLGSRDHHCQPTSSSAPFTISADSNSLHRSPPTLPKPAPIPRHHNHHHPLRRHVASPRSHQQDRVLEQREGTDRFLSRCLDRRVRIQVCLSGHASVL